ncbi:MAG: hypothetical protein KIT73_08280, partial [Burkholderiales bacterium]|nr:hypothetical protein [Burkholderiales bacterium]
TALYPVHLHVPANAGTDHAIKHVKTTLRAVPGHGLGYGVLRHLDAGGDPAAADALRMAPEIRFNYLGQTDQIFATDGGFGPAPEATGAARHPADRRDVLLDINALVSRGELSFHWTYSRAIHRHDTIAQRAQACVDTLRRLIDHCLSAEADGGHVPTDFPLMNLDAAALDTLLDSL